MTLLRNIFINSEDRRLRALWRILFFVALNFSLTLLVFILVSALIDMDPQVLSARNLLVGAVANAIGVGVAIYISRRFADRKTIQSLGIQPDHLWRDLMVGFGIAAVVSMVVYAGLWAGNWVTFEGFIWETVALTEWVQDLLFMIVLFVLVGLIEELQFRGYILQNAEEGLNTFWAVLLSAAFFAFMHYGNPAGAAFAPIASLLAIGCVFGFGYLRTRSLWLVIGLHFGWNFILNSILGLPISGLESTGIMTHTVYGPELWTGGSFGPEAGLVVVPAQVVSILLIYAYTRNR